MGGQELLEKKLMVRSDPGSAQTIAKTIANNGLLKFTETCTFILAHLATHPIICATTTHQEIPLPTPPESPSNDMCEKCVKICGISMG